MNFFVDLNVSGQEETEDGVVNMNAPMVVDGFFLAYDNNNYYVGHNKNTVSKIISRAHAGMMELIPPRSKAQETFESIPMDTNMKGAN